MKMNECQTNITDYKWENMHHALFRNISDRLGRHFPCDSRNSVPVDIRGPCKMYHNVVYKL